jgi:hypothetical protein
MFSIRRARMLVLIVGGAMLAGCEAQIGPRNPPRMAVDTTPIRTDNAMAIRQWEPISAGIPNDGVLAYPTYEPLEPTGLPYKLNAVTETFLFMGNTIYTPVGVFIEVPWKFDAYKSFLPAPGYTWMPPLPDGPEPVPN